MKVTKSELREMVRECLKEELTEDAFSGGVASSGSVDTSARAGGQKKDWKDALEGKKTKTIKAKDLKPGMVTSTGVVRSVKNLGWVNGQQTYEISYGGIGAQGSHASDEVPADREYQILDEACDNKDLTEDTIFENLY